MFHLTNFRPELTKSFDIESSGFLAVFALLILLTVQVSKLVFVFLISQLLLFLIV